MSMSDPIADLLSRLRNAQHAEMCTVDIPASGTKKALAVVLKAEGYIKSITEGKDENGFHSLKLKLKYYQGSPVI